MRYYLFGSENSLDYDILVEYDSIPKDIDKAHAVCKDFNDKLALIYTDKKINCNLITIKDNQIIECHKGTIDELNNCLFYTYGLHKQAFPNPRLAVLKKIDFVKMTEFTGKKEKPEDVWKVLAFQFGQVFSLIESCEEDSYTKNGIKKNYSSFANLLNRFEPQLEDLFNLNIYLWKFIRYIELNINNLRIEEKRKDI